MSLPAKAIQELQDLYYKKFGEKIDSQRALDMGMRLVTLMSAVFRPIPDKNKDKDAEKNTTTQ